MARQADHFGCLSSAPLGLPPRSDLPSTPAPPRNRTIAEFCTTGPPAAVLRPLPDLKFAAGSMAWKPVHDRGQVSHSVVRHCSYKQSSASGAPGVLKKPSGLHTETPAERAAARLSGIPGPVGYGFPTPVTSAPDFSELRGHAEGGYDIGYKSILGPKEVYGQGIPAARGPLAGSDAAIN